jgi:hypothetical protein
MSSFTGHGFEAGAAAAAAAVGTAAVLCGAGVLLVTWSVRAALPVFLDLLLAAGLLRLAVTDSWTAIGSAAAVVVRKLAVAGITRSAAPRASSTSTARPS